MKTKVNAEEITEGLKEWIRAQAEFIREPSSKAIHIVEQPRQEPSPLQMDEHHPEEEDGAEAQKEELDP